MLSRCYIQLNHSTLVDDNQYIIYLVQTKQRKLISQAREYELREKNLIWEDRLVEKKIDSVDPNMFEAHCLFTIQIAFLFVGKKIDGVDSYWFEAHCLI